MLCKNKSIKDPVFIYGLKCPLSGDIRYIGKSVDPLQRFKKHINYEIKSDTHKARWLNKLIALGLLPELIIIEEVDKYQWEEREKFWIVYYKDSLTNETIGGDGRQGGWKHKKESVDKIVIALKSRSLEIRQGAAHKISLKLKGSHPTEKAKANQRKACQEYWEKISPTEREKRTKHLLRVWTDVNKNNLSRTLTGSKHKNTTSLFKGVSWFKRDRCWRAWIHHNGKQIHLGYFETEKAAAIAYDRAAKKYYKEFANLNFK